MTDTGTILVVAEVIIGSELAAQALVGATTLQVQDSGAFAAGGGLLDLNGDRYTYTAVDHETDTLTVDPALTATYDVETPVAIIDPSTDAPATQTTALVDIEDDMEAVQALVPFTLRTFLPTGIREPGLGELVAVDWNASGAVIVDVLGQRPIVQAESLPPLESGNSVYRGPTAPWLDGDAAHADDGGDVWWQETTTVDTDGNTITTSTPWIWDGATLTWVDVSDPQIDLVAGIADTLDETVTDLSTRVDSVSQTATNARNIATTADGRVSFSDYDPAPDDIAYLAFTPDGQPIIDPDTGQQVLINRQPGSIWHTRTRARRNVLSNPSFEVDLAGWSAVGGAVPTRVAATPSSEVGGAWAAQLVNGTTAGGLAPITIPVQPGEVWTVSAFGQLVSGAGSAWVHYTVKDSSGTTLASGDGSTATLETGSWARPWATVSITQSTAVTLDVQVLASASVTWLLDGALAEVDDILGRYFDGDSEAASWDGAAHASASTLTGGLITDVYELLDGSWVRMDYTGTTQYDADASDLTHGTLSPALIADQSLPIDKLATDAVVAFEALTAGDLVHVFDNGGVPMIRRADAQNARAAHGFILDDVAIGDAVPVYTFGYNPIMSGLLPGTVYLGTAGNATATPALTAGWIVQPVGVASDATTLHFTPGVPIRIL